MHRETARLTLFAAAAAAVASAGCGDLPPETAPQGGGEPSIEARETRQAAITAAPSRALDPQARFFTPPPSAGAVQQIVDLVKSRHLLDAARLTAMEATPLAVWFTDGTPAEVKAAVRKTVKAAAALRTVPVLVAYDIPFRDCAQYSAGGAIDAAAYEAWTRGGRLVPAAGARAGEKRRAAAVVRSRLRNETLGRAPIRGRGRYTKALCRRRSA